MARSAGISLAILLSTWKRVRSSAGILVCRFFFNDTSTTEIYTLSLHDALPISLVKNTTTRGLPFAAGSVFAMSFSRRSEEHTSELQSRQYIVCRLLLEKKEVVKGTFRRIWGRRAPEINIKRDGSPADNRLPRAVTNPHTRTVSGAKNNPFVLNPSATTEIDTLSLHDALPI